MALPLRLRYDGNSGMVLKHAVHDDVGNRLGECTRYRPDSPLRPDVLHTGIFYGCKASNGARATSALRFKLFSEKTYC